MTDKKYELPQFTEQIQELLEQGGLAQFLAQDPLLHSFKSLVIASDYSGESGSKVRTYAFLLSGFEMLQVWYDEARRFRENHNIGLMEYKYLDDRKRQRVLPDWLSLLNRVGGHLIIVSIDSSLPSAFGARPRELLDLLQGKGFDAWNKNDIEKLLRILHLVGLLIKHTTHPKQNVLWLSDRDSIIGDPDEEPSKLQQLLALFPRIANLYVEHELGKVGLAVPSKSKPDPTFEEILTIPDLACGAVTAYWNTDPYEKWGKYWEARVPIYKFLNEEQSNLQKHFFYIKPVKVQGGTATETLRYKFELSKELQEHLKKRSNC